MCTQIGALPKQKQAKMQPLAGTPPGRPPGWRLRVTRWVETQRQLWAEQRLNSNQLRYMALLGGVLPNETSICLATSPPNNTLNPSVASDQEMTGSLASCLAEDTASRHAGELAPKGMLEHLACFLHRHAVFAVWALQVS